MRAGRACSARQHQRREGLREVQRTPEPLPPTALPTSNSRAAAISVGRSRRNSAAWPPCQQPGGGSGARKATDLSSPDWCRAGPYRANANPTA
jgi:hypothetical protein